MSALSKRFYDFSESHNLLPDCQYGFRKHLSCLSAASILFETVSSRLRRKLRTYACFVDYSKAFDTVNRPLLFQKLQLLGFPFEICQLLHDLYASLQFRVRVDSTLAVPFKTSLGTPQGDPLSPLLFSLFLYDLPSALPVFDFPISLLLFADDTLLLADSAEHLQTLIDALGRYASDNFLTINVSKTKCLVFHRGRLPSCSFHLAGSSLDIVNSFRYLGLTFTVQLSFSAHLTALISKANSRVGLLFRQLPLTSLPLRTVLQVFDCFILSMFRYGLHLWFSSVSKSALDSLNSLFTKFLKRYLLLPKFTSNAIIHFLTNTTPLSHRLLSIIHTNPLKAGFPPSLQNMQLSFLNSLPPLPDSYQSFALVPSSFWCTRTIFHIPSNPSFRKSLLSDTLSSFLSPPWER